MNGNTGGLMLELGNAGDRAGRGRAGLPDRELAGLAPTAVRTACRGRGMTAVVTASGLGKRYGLRWALRYVTVSVPEAEVVGRVGPSRAGKTTLLHPAAGLLAPTAGSISVLGARPASGPARSGARRWSPPSYTTGPGGWPGP
jgi:ABC-type glutathione transport system ATPase component